VAEEIDRSSQFGGASAFRRGKARSTEHAATRLRNENVRRARARRFRIDARDRSGAEGKRSITQWISRGEGGEGKISSTSICARHRFSGYAMRRDAPHRVGTGGAARKSMAGRENVAVEEPRDREGVPSDDEKESIS